MTTARARAGVVAIGLLLALGCGGEAEGPADRVEGRAPGPVPAAVSRLLTPWRGSFDDMVRRRAIRVLVSASDTHFFLDGLRPRGLAADALRAFERQLNRRQGLGARRLQLVPIPVARDQLLSYLERGLGDMAAGNLTITAARSARVAFSVPFYTGVDEIVVTGPGGPALDALEDLAGREVFVRRSSSFHASLEDLNARLRAGGREPSRIRPASEHLETGDILELVHAGVVDITVADSHVAGFWSEVLEGLVLHPHLALRTGGEIGWALRKDAAGLKPVVDRFVRSHRKGTLIGNVLHRRYLADPSRAALVRDGRPPDRLDGLSDLLRRYAERYGFDWRLIAAQAFQESGLDHARRSRAGAVGLMQILPATAADPAVAIPDIEGLEDNVHAGVKYLRHLVDTYFDEPGMGPFDRQLFALAAYNAGPSRIRRLRSVAATRGLDPDRWLGHVERVVAEEVGREPVQYVRNILRNYTAYTLTLELEAARQKAADAL